VVKLSLVKPNLSAAGLTRAAISSKDASARRSLANAYSTTNENKQESGMPEITVSMAAGRTDEQKAGMMRDITQALVKNLGVDADAVVIQINEAPLAHKMKGGKTFVERAAAAKK
jgi:4-oxalocrotonate tautomerase